MNSINNIFCPHCEHAYDQDSSITAVYEAEELAFNLNCENCEKDFSVSARIKFNTEKETIEESEEEPKEKAKGFFS